MNQRSELNLIRLSFMLSLLICLGKFTAWFYTHSLVILSDALESVINVAGAAFAWYSVYLSSKPRDADHPYGHGKVEFFSIGFEGALIFIAGIAILIQSVKLLIAPEPIRQVGLGAWMTTIAGLANFLLGWLLLRWGRQRNSLVLQGNGRHLLTDSYTSIGVLLALVLIYFTGWTWVDPAASAIAGGIIVYTGFQLLRKSIRGLMDETDPGVVQEVVDILQSRRQPEWIDMHNLRIQRFGNFYHVDCHVTLPYYLPLNEVHESITQIDKLLNQEFRKGSIEFFIHTDPCIEQSCAHCTLHDCPVRQHAFVQVIPWTVQNVMTNQKHLADYPR